MTGPGAVKVQFKVFRSSVKSWDNLLREAADFASGLNPNNLLTISHSADNMEGVVVVWYWGEESLDADDR